MKISDRRRKSTDQADEFGVALQELSHAINQLNKIVANVKKLSESMGPNEASLIASSLPKIIH